MANNMSNNMSNNARNMPINMNNDQTVNSPFSIEWDFHRRTAAQVGLREAPEPRPLYGSRARNIVPASRASQQQAQEAPKLHNSQLPIRTRKSRPEHRIASAPRHHWADAAYRAQQEELSRARASQREEQEAADTLLAFMQNEYREEAAFIAAAQAEFPLAPSNSRVRQSAGIDIRNLGLAADPHPLTPEIDQGEN
ncbi:hypothetical protein E2P81_ATG09266 [Venturia nashicola]|uniref:Uncharacterized protein n=1 Tax=Venturia nashicola TaxID=86259 RepID=A0A4Z1NKR2_9PEZI|nr:hypothetical protein E6O75_ATG09471 [Venturia nashicola]TLD20196.1 hypothetical protein E2P81_ATG09266 [Venturia nashicola]